MGAEGGRALEIADDCNDIITGDAIYTYDRNCSGNIFKHKLILSGKYYARITLSGIRDDSYEMITIFRLIQKQMKLSSVPNQSEII